jgi:hypothetical protein
MEGSSHQLSNCHFSISLPHKDLHLRLQLPTLPYLLYNSVSYFLSCFGISLKFILVWINEKYLSKGYSGMRYKRICIPYFIQRNELIDCSFYYNVNSDSGDYSVLKDIKWKDLRHGWLGYIGCIYRVLRLIQLLWNRKSQISDSHFLHRRGIHRFSYFISLFANINIFLNLINLERLWALLND